MASETPLCRLATAFLTDKGPNQHGYTAHYYKAIDAHLEKPVKRVGEIGIGFLDCMAHVSFDYKPGASLRMWEAFFPEAEIHGFDIDRSILYSEGRIKCHYMDQENPESVREALGGCGGEFDLILDDGSHLLHHQVNTKMIAGEFLRVGGLLIIEDIEFRFLDYWFSEPPPEFELVAISDATPHDNFVIYRKLQTGTADA
jgi:hypothetical protein